MTKEHSSSQLTRIRILTVSIALASLLSSTIAAALTEREAATVVHLLESLQEELGDFAYDAHVAQDWFEQDAESQGLIEAAGFTASSWQRALDATFRGFLANVPEAEIRRRFEEMRQRLGANRSLTPAQKSVALQLANKQELEILQWRAQGRAFADIVASLTERLRALSGAQATPPEHQHD